MMYFFLMSFFFSVPKNSDVSLRLNFIFRDVSAGHIKKAIRTLVLASFAEVSTTKAPALNTSATPMSINAFPIKKL